MTFDRSGLHRSILTFPIILLTLALAPVARSQSPDTSDAADRLGDRGHEVQIWTGGGGDPIGEQHVTQGNAVWNVGVRYGWIVTGAHGPGILRGRLEYAVEALPVVMVFQPGGKSYGFGFSPWVTKWNFQPHRRVSPYIELGGGGLISTKEIPAGENRFNFTPSGAIGVNLLRGKYHWSIDFRYFHISDANLTNFNPGTDTFGVRIGWGTFSH